MPDVQHSKRFLAEIQVYGQFDRLNYLVKDLKIKFTGGAKPVQQKGRKIASAMKGQPIVTVNMKLFMRETDFGVVVTNAILNNYALLVRIGKVRKTTRVTNAQANISEDQDVRRILEESELLFKMIGFIQDAEIIAELGEYIIVDLTLLADDIAELDPEDLELFLL